MMEIWKRSIAAGILIGIASALFVNMSDQRIAGAVLFAFALFFVCLLGLDLFTGKIGWLGMNAITPGYALQILAGNLIGILIIDLIASAANPFLASAADDLIEAKMEAGYFALFCRGILCGIMMYLAVAGYKRGSGTTAVIGIFFAVPVFILAGFEHSIADAGYMVLAGRYDFLLCLLIIIAGNAIGSICIRLLIEGGPLIEKREHILH